MKSTSQYVLGDSDAEHDRLTRQAAVLAPFTLRLFQDAGLKKGHRVLDIGCGMGDVARLAAETVGVEGLVVAIDSDSCCIEKARKRSSESGLSNIEFVETDIARFVNAGPFDVIVGRLVLQFMPHPVEVMRSLASMLRPGGVMVFQESNWEALLSQVQTLPLRRECCQLIHESFKLSNANVNIGPALLGAFKQIQFSEPRLRLDVPIGVSSIVRQWVYDLVCSLYPRFIRYGLPTSELGDFATLQERLDIELDLQWAYAICIGLTGVWAEKAS